MAHSRTARKAVRQNASHRALNRWRLTTMREAIKDFREQILHGTMEAATESFRKCSRVIDVTAAKGVIHKNQAARRKSRMSAALKAKKLGKASTASPAKTQKPAEGAKSAKPATAAAPKAAAPKAAAPKAAAPKASKPKA